MQCPAFPRTFCSPGTSASLPCIHSNPSFKAWLPCFRYRASENHAGLLEAYFFLEAWNSPPRFTLQCLFLHSVVDVICPVSRVAGHIVSVSSMLPGADKLDRSLVYGIQRFSRLFYKTHSGHDTWRGAKKIHWKNV